MSDVTRRWHDALYDSTLPYWLIDRLNSTISYLATGTCRIWKNGRFWAWEGVTCCPGTCTHVWNYAHGHARIFPDLARNIRQRQDLMPKTEDPDGGFHPDTGLVGFRHDDKYAADGQCGTVLKAYREHQMSPDMTFLNRNWTKIKKVLDFSIRRDKVQLDGQQLKVTVSRKDDRLVLTLVDAVVIQEGQTLEVVASLSLMGGTFLKEYNLSTRFVCIFSSPQAMPAFCGDSHGCAVLSVCSG